MDTKELNKYPIKNYLEALNIHPVKNKAHHGLYHVSFREDHTAGMKVDYQKNLWIDYGSGL